MWKPIEYIPVLVEDKSPYVSEEIAKHNFEKHVDEKTGENAEDFCAKFLFCFEQEAICIYFGENMFLAERCDEAKKALAKIYSWFYEDEKEPVHEENEYIVLRGYISRDAKCSLEEGIKKAICHIYFDDKRAFYFCLNFTKKC